MRSWNVVCALTALALGGISLTGCVVERDHEPDVNITTPRSPGPPGPQGQPGPPGSQGAPGPSKGGGY